MTECFCKAVNYFCKEAQSQIGFAGILNMLLSHKTYYNFGNKNGIDMNNVNNF